MTDDWQAVEGALTAIYPRGSDWEATEAFDALARLREREAQRERQYANEKEGDSLIVQTWQRRAEAAEARVAEIELVFDVYRQDAQARVAELEEALRGLTTVAEQYMDTERGDLDGWLEVARRALEDHGA